MNIFFLVGYDLDKSPWATRPRAILKEILAKGHSVTIADLEQADRDHPSLHPPIESSERVSRLRLKRHWIHPLDTPLAVWTSLHRVQPCLANANVVHIHKPTILTWAIGRKARTMGKPMIYDWDDLEGTGGIRSGWNGRKVDWIEGFFAANSAAIVVASHELEGYIDRRYPNHVPLYFGPCGVDTAIFDRHRVTLSKINSWKQRLGLTDEKVLIYHGQLEMGDSGETLLQALKQLSTDYRIRLLLVGGGRIQKSMVDMADSIGLSQCVISTGFVPFVEVPHLLALSDVAVVLLPDNAYGRCKSPLKIYEAMAMGLPTIASSVGQAKEILADCGILVSPGDSNALANALKRLLDSPDQMHQLGTKAQAAAIERHSWKNLAGLFLDLYEQCHK